MNNKDNTWSKLVTFIDTSTGGVDKVRTVSAGDREKVVAKLLDQNHYDYVETRKGMSEKDFIEEGSNWLKNKVEVKCDTDFPHIMRKGVPDFCVGDPKAKRMYFIEVKAPSDGLRTSQLRWIRLFDSVPLKIAYVETKNDWTDRPDYY